MYLQSNVQIDRETINRDPVVFRSRPSWDLVWLPFLFLGLAFFCRSNARPEEYREPLFIGLGLAAIFAVCVVGFYTEIRFVKALRRLEVTHRLFGLSLPHRAHAMASLELFVHEYVGKIGSPTGALCFMLAAKTDRFALVFPPEMPVADANLEEVASLLGLPPEACLVRKTPPPIADLETPALDSAAADPANALPVSAYTMRAQAAKLGVRIKRVLQTSDIELRDRVLAALTQRKILHCVEICEGEGGISQSEIYVKEADATLAMEAVERTDQDMREETSTESCEKCSTTMALEFCPPEKDEVHLGFQRLVCAKCGHVIDLPDGT